MKIKIIKNEFLKNFSYFLKLENNLGNPTIQQIEPTNACMMDCIMCPRRNMKRKVKLMDLNLFKKIIDQCRWNDEIWLHHFGDPLMHPKLDEMIFYVSKKGIKPKMSVNPNLLSKEKSRKLIKSGLHTIMISLDGVDDKTYRYFRGKNANYKKAIENINNLLAAKKELNSELYIVLSMIRMKANKKDAENFKKIWSKKGVNEVSIKQFVTWDGSDKKILEQGDKDTLSRKHKKEKKYCSEPWMKFSVTVDGKVVPCCYDYDEKFVLGDASKKTLKEIWNSNKIKILRRQIKSGKLKNPLCCSCVDKIDTSIMRYNILRLKPRHLKLLLRKIKKKKL